MLNNQHFYNSFRCVNRLAAGSILVLLGILASSNTAFAQEAGTQPINPYLADSIYPFGHGGPHQQDSLPVAGPEDVSRALRPDEIEYTHTGPGLFGIYTSGPYPDGRRVLWGNGLDRIVKLDYDTHKVIATRMIEGVPHYDEAQANESIEYFDENNDGFLALAEGFQQAQKLRSLSSIYTLTDNTNTYYIAHQDGYIEAFGDADPNVPESKIELKRRFNFPESITGYAMGLNMSYDGWLILVTEHGHLLALKPDFSEYRLGRLKHSAGAAEKSTRPTGGGWVRNAPAVGQDGGVYVASQNHMHKAMWTGEEFSTNEADGAWAVEYDNSWGHGSGATPSLMGFGDDADKFVVITDGNSLMNLILYWRNEIPGDWEGIEGQPRRVAGILPITMGKLDLKAIQSEQSVVVEGYGALVVNNNPRNLPWYLPGRAKSLLLSYLGSNPNHQPYGVQKFAWNPDKRQLKVAWVADSISSPSCVPIVSQKNQRVYLIGARNNKWTLESLSWETGESMFHYVIGGQRYNPFFSGTLLDEHGRIHFGTPWGRVRLNPKN